MLTRKITYLLPKIMTVYCDWRNQLKIGRPKTTTTDNKIEKII